MSDKNIKILDQWTVYMLHNRNMYLGHLLVTDTGIAFQSMADLRSDSIRVAGGLTLGTGPYSIYAKENKLEFILPYTEITNVEIKKKLFILKNLVINTKKCEELVFRFGMLSPQKALDLIEKQLN